MRACSGLGLSSNVIISKRYQQQPKLSLGDMLQHVYRVPNMNALKPRIKLEMDITETPVETEDGYSSIIQIRISSSSPEACSKTASAIEQAVRLIYDMSGPPALPKTLLLLAPLQSRARVAALPHILG